MILKVNKVAASVNDANVFSYIPADTVKLWETTATTVIIYHHGKDVDGMGDDTVTITAANITQVKAIAERLADLMGDRVNMNRAKAIMTIDKDFALGGITTITQSTTA